MAQTDEKQHLKGTAKQDTTDEGVASAKDNLKLKHSQGGITTRDDLHDTGVPMLPGSPDEPTGPEDALGRGPKRGDYSERIGPSHYHPHESELIPSDDREADGPISRLVAQRPRVEDRGDAPGKGGVDAA
jgi:hypothetical protein